MPRRPTLYLLTCILALVTAATLVVAGASVENARFDAPSTATTETTVHAFRNTVNSIIRTGDVSDLDTVVAAEFVDHAPAPGMTPDRAGLAHYLLGVHATYPDAEIIINEMVAVGDRALVRMTARGTEHGAFLGLPLTEEPTVWNSLDVFRVSDRQIVEHWSGADGLVVFESLGQAPLDPRLPTSQGVAFERHTMAPDEHREFHDPDEARLLWVEKGAITFEIAQSSPSSALLLTATASTTQHRRQDIEPGNSLTLEAGDLLSLPKLTRYEIRNEAAQPATTVVAAVFTPGSPSRSTARADPAYPGEESPSRESHATLVNSSDAMQTEPALDFLPRIESATQLLAGDKLTTLPPGPASISIGRMTLAPGAGMTIDDAAGPVAFSIEAGALDLKSVGAAAWVRRGSNGASSEVSAGTLVAGDGALLQPWTTATFENVGNEPLVVLILTIQPDGDDRYARS